MQVDILHLLQGGKNVLEPDIISHDIKLPPKMPLCRNILVHTRYFRNF